MELEPRCIPARLLLVDDSPTNLRFLAHVLHNMGEIFFATDGPSALKIARDKQPDLILLDVEMPGMTGYDVCQQMKQEPLLSDVAIIFVTSHQSMDHEVRALEVGAVDFITKPLNPPIVRARVRTHLTLKQQSDKLRRLANRDGMTGVFNRRALDEILAVEFRRHMRIAAPLGLAMLDVDFFKQFNDKYGHQAGDECLRRVASLLSQVLRREDDLAARYGGEEFVLILPFTDLSGALRVAGLVQKGLSELAIPHKMSQVSPHVTCSLGVATLIPSMELVRTELVEMADVALYRAKKNGRNRIEVAD